MPRPSTGEIEAVNIMKSPALERPIRVLHVVSRLNRGGIETWLMNLWRNIDRARFQFDFLVNEDSECHYSEEARALGSSFLVCPPRHSGSRLVRQLSTVLAGHAPYDVLHAHKHHYCGQLMKASSLMGIPVRIAHSHTTTTGRKQSVLHTMYQKYMQHLIHRHATHGIACSPESAQDLFGSNWKSDSRWSVLECGMDLSVFSKVPSDPCMRHRMGFHVSDFIIGHVGRLDPAKNHDFLLGVFADLRRRLPCAKLVLVGHGELESEIRATISKLELEHSVVMLGSRADVPELLVNLFDTFILPSRYEGLPLSVIEAQAAGLHCLVSDRVTKTVKIPKSQLDFLPITSMEPWVSRLTELHQTRGRLPLSAALANLEGSPFSLETCLKRLCKEYESAVSLNRLRRSA